MLCLTTCRLNRLPYADVCVEENCVLSPAAVCDLWILIDSDVTMWSHVPIMVFGCFVVLRWLCSIRRSVSNSVFYSLVMSLFVQSLDYSNVTLAGLPTSQLRRLQWVPLGAVTRPIHQSSQHEHGTLILWDLNWLRSSKHIDLKLTMLVYWCLHDYHHGISPTTVVGTVNKLAIRKTESVSRCGSICSTNSLYLWWWCSRWRWRNIRRHWKRSEFWWSPRTFLCFKDRLSPLQWRMPRNVPPCLRRWAGLSVIDL